MIAGRYQLEVLLGRGASGQVWRGRDVTMRRPVAVKVVQLDQITDAPHLAETIARFRREALTVGQLKHPNIVAAYEAGRVGNELFLVMELAEGRSLADLVEQRTASRLGPLPISSVLDIAEQACAGLAAAHAAGVVHRDIKPSNLMVAVRLQTKIIDFGVARLLTDDGSPRLTRRGQQIGTLLYVSPEQAEGGDIDGRADLYSFGCVLYELLAGRPPFTAEMPSALLHKQLNERPVPLGELRHDLPAGLDELVSDLMEKDPDDRPADAEQVIARIRAIRTAMEAGGSAEPALDADRRTMKPDLEADRRTVKPDLEAGRYTVQPAGAGQLAASGAVDPALLAVGAAAGAADVAGDEAGRGTVLTPEALAEMTGEQGHPSPSGAGPSSGAAGGIGTVRTRGDKPGPGKSGPGKPGPDKADAVKAWTKPGRSRARSRRRLRNAVSTFITVAIVAAVGTILWLRTHETLKVTAVAVAPAQQPGNSCNVTVKVLGTIFTNGHGGQITYQWVRGSGQTSPVSTVSAASGQASTQVQLLWSFRGRGTDLATAELRVLTPDPATGMTSFTYSCS